MSAPKLDRREQDAERHLAAAAEYIAIAESGDAERSAYEHAAIEIARAMEEDSTLTQTEVARRLGKGKNYVSSLLLALSRAQDSGEFRVEWRSGLNRRQVVVEKAAANRPDDFVAAFEAAPPEAQQRIAERLSQSPDVRIEVRKRDLETREKTRPNERPMRPDLALFNFESRLDSARRYLRIALDLANGIDQPGDDEDILDTIETLKQLVDAIDSSYRSGQSVDSWAWGLFQESTD